MSAAPVLTERPFVLLRELEAGARFMFFADDLPDRGPCTLIEKRVGSATIKYEPHEKVTRFRARNRKTGEMEEKEIRRMLSGQSVCTLSAQVIPL